MEGATLERLHDALLAKKVNGGAGLKKGTVLTEELLAVLSALIGSSCAWKTVH
jgi:DNA-directed RNA polymerase subunit beta